MYEIQEAAVRRVATIKARPSVNDHAVESFGANSKTTCANTPHTTEPPDVPDLIKVCCTRLSIAGLRLCCRSDACSQLLQACCQVPVEGCPQHSLKAAMGQSHRRRQLHPGWQLLQRRRRSAAVGGACGGGASCSSSSGSSCLVQVGCAHRLLPHCSWFKLVDRQHPVAVPCTCRGGNQGGFWGRSWPLLL